MLSRDFKICNDRTRKVCLVQLPVRQIACYTDKIVLVIALSVNSGMKQKKRLCPQSLISGVVI